MKTLGDAVCHPWRRSSLAVALALAASLVGDRAGLARREGPGAVPGKRGQGSGAVAAGAPRDRAAAGAKTKGLCEGVDDDHPQVEVVQLTFFHSSLPGSDTGKGIGASPYPLLTDLVASLNKAFAVQEAKATAGDEAAQPKPAPSQPVSGMPALRQPPVPGRAAPRQPPVLNPSIELPGQESGQPVQGAGETQPKPAKSEERTVVEDLGFGRLLLHGTRCQNVQMKRALARIDVPWPGVQLNMWAIQVSGKEHSSVSKEVHKIHTWISNTREDIVKAQRELKRLAAVESFPCRWPEDLPPPSFASPPLAAELLSVNEALILLSLRPDGSERIESLAKGLAANSSACLQMRAERLKRCGPDSAQADGCRPPYERLRETLEQSRAPEICGALRRFYTSYHAVRELRYEDATGEPDDERKQEGILNEVEHARDVADRVLRALIDAYAADMEDLFFDPLLEQIRAEECMSKHGEGTAIVGRNRIVVTSGMVADLLPEINSYIETTPQRPFGNDLLDLLSPAKKSDKGASGAQRLLSELPQGEAALLAAALVAAPEPRYAKVAPGIAINVVPAVLPDESAARLTIDARFGVNVEELDPKARKDPWTQPPPAGIIRHHVRTDVTVGVFDLFDVSSFSMDVTTPQRARLIPILGRLPILGPAFQWPLPDETVHHESIILVNTVILPRSTMLTERF
jgi:hypothetical protein